MPGGLLRQAPAGPVPLRQADVFAQQKPDGPGTAVQPEDLRLEVVLMAVAGQHQQGLFRRQRRQSPLPPVKQQTDALQLHKKAAVGQKCHPHHRNFTAVP